MRVLSVFSLLAMLLAAVGIHGVMAYSVEARTREIGIRLALGSTNIAVMRAVLGRAFKLTAAGVVLGIGGAMVATRLLASLLFEVQTTDASTLLAGSVLVAAVSTVAGLTPALRATRVDPIAVLRYE